MSNLITTAQTMSSREIAELTGKNHADVLRDIRKMLLDLELGESSFAGSYLSEQNKAMPLFNLDREHTDCLLTGYSAKARMLVIKRWHELEAKQAPQLPTTYISALEALLALKKEEAALQEQLTIAAPKVEHFDLYVSRDSVRSITYVAKGIGLSAIALGKLMREQGILFKRTDRQVWMQWFIDKGYGVTKQITANGKDYDQPMVTNTGDVYLKAQFGNSEKESK